MSVPVRTGRQSLVVVVCTVPLLSEAVEASFRGIAEVRSFPGELEDTDGLLRSVDPDAIVVDSEPQAEAAEAYARETGTPLVHVILREQQLRVLRNGTWHVVDGNGAASPETIRNVLVAGMWRQPA
jgi:hypothetical protein